MIPTLSILTPAVPSRLMKSGRQAPCTCDTPGHAEHCVAYSDLGVSGLMRELERQIGNKLVEHLVLIDNKKRTVGEKRDALLRVARGQYVAFVDDDDWISPDYVSELLKAAKGLPDVITFRQFASINGKGRGIEFRLGNPNEAWEPDRTELLPPIKRNAWHVCAWKRSLAILSHFPVSNYGEDWAFAAPLCAMPNLKEVHIPKVLHFYYHSTETTEAPPPDGIAHPERAT